ncbi:hypothetical protein HLV35_03320 [Eggerthellaceae bacterium zg-997]|nr:hypothetical protein [Eggerthellaceae bacterium zg-997]
MDLGNLLLGPQQTRARAYTRRQGNIAYLDGACLRRESRLRGTNLAVAGALVAVAVLAGAYVMKVVALDPVAQAEKAAAATQANMSRTAATETLPALSGLVGLNADQVKAALDDAGLSYIERPVETEGALSVYHYPADLDLDLASTLYLKGFSALSPEQATRLMTGAWQLDLSKEGATSLSAHFADFASPDLKTALAAAASAQGLDPASATESGTDDSGNTFLAGTLEQDGATYNWRISGIELSSVYRIKGLDAGLYLGIRITQA